MATGTGLDLLEKARPKQYFDVGIAEQHAVTMAAGMACEGLRPVCAIYSTFLQRALDMVIHDVALQSLPVVFAVDRGGLVGEDGATHAGSFDISFLRCIPNMVVMTPSDENEARQMLHTGYQHPGPASVRYPRGTGPGAGGIGADRDHRLLHALGGLAHGIGEGLRAGVGHRGAVDRVLALRVDGDVEQLRLVRRRLARLDAQLGMEPADELVGAHQCAHERFAHLHVEFPNRFQVEYCIKRNCFVHLRWRQFQQLAQ